MSIIKFSMSKGDPILLPWEKAEKVIDSENQIIKVTDDNGNWTGKTINKAHLVSTDIDVEASREQSKQLAREATKLEIAPSQEKGTQKMAEILAANKPEFLRN